MTTNKTNLQELAHKLDNSIGKTRSATETVDDISTELLQLVDEMNNLQNEENLRIYHRDWHRHLRILAKLLYHASNDLVEGTKESHAVSEVMFDEIVKKEK